eukprot:jgi/Botrbrau1/1445/Bobra.178_3s0003.1
MPLAFHLQRFIAFTCTFGGSLFHTIPCKLSRTCMARIARGQGTDIWTSGPILDAIQTAAIFNDSKTFV